MTDLNQDNLLEKLKEFAEFSAKHLVGLLQESHKAELSEAEAKQIIRQGLAPQQDERQEAQKLIELGNQLAPMLSMIAGLQPRVAPTQLSNNAQLNQQMGLGGNQAQNQLVHPKLAPFLDQAASSFLDAYREIQAENENPNQARDAQNENRNTNELTLQYKLAMKNALKFAPKPGQGGGGLRPENQEQYVPRVKPSPF